MYFDPTRLVLWAIAVVVIGLAINYAVTLVLAVWPVLAVIAGLLLLGLLLHRWWRRGPNW